ncbi:MAG: hypothetical protein CTY36_16540, partial [Methylocystis sp.]
MEGMMATTLAEVEGTPAAYPPKPSNLSMTARNLPYSYHHIWQRIEAYTAYRFSPRSIQWVAEGPGYWLPPLSPATITTSELWSDDAWQVIDAPPGSPLGGFNLPTCAHYRFSGTVGAGPVPEIVNAACARLAEFLANVAQSNGVRREE